MENNTKKIGILSLFVAATLSASAMAEVNETIEKTYDFDSNGRIQLSNVNGDVTVSACNCSQVTMVANISASDQETRDRISIEIEDSTSNLRIKTRYKNNHNRSNNNTRSEVTYTLSVPNNVHLDDIDLVNGNLKISGVTGELNADLVNGELESDGLTSTTRVNMVNGNMDIKFSNLKNAKRVNLESVNGDIVVYLPSDADASLDAETVSGKISNEFGINVIKHKYVGSEMRGSIGSGGVKIDMENVNGKIAVKTL